MKPVGSISRALVASFAAAAGTGTILTRLEGSQDFLTVVLGAVMFGAPVSILLFTFASLRPERRRAMRRLAVTLTILLTLVTAGMALAHFGAQGTVAAAWPGVRRMLILLAACEVVVLVQWLIIRREPAPKAEPAMQFGRAGAMNTGGKK